MQDVRSTGGEWRMWYYGRAGRCRNQDGLGFSGEGVEDPKQP